MGHAASSQARPGMVIGLVGGLGAGKTHWTKGFVAGLGSPADVTSPTFGLVHEYPGGRLPVVHMDLYRVQSHHELLDLGWDEYLDSGAVLVVEWADKFPALLPADATWLIFHIEPCGSRSVRVRPA